MTIREVIQHSTRFLEGKGVESPRLQGEHLLAHVLGLPRLQLYLNIDRPLTEAEISTTRALVQRRGRREPLQHILGTANFAGLELKVTPDVLIPRPETELLAEQAVAFLKGLGAPISESAEHVAGRQAGSEAGNSGSRRENQSLLTSAIASVTMLDIGTGSGCLPIYVTHRLAECEAWTVDVSEAAIAIARENAGRHGVAERL